MAQKWPKNAICGPKMLQITYNLDIWCILMIFIDFQKILNFYQKLPNFWAKNTRFLPTLQKFGKMIFDGKSMRFFKNGPIDPIYGRNVP